MADPGADSPSIDVLVEGAGWAALDFDAATLARRAAAAALAGVPGVDGAETSILLADDGRLAALNREWRGRDGPTNVLSFPAFHDPVPGVPGLLGDVAVSCETVLREAAEAGIPVEHHLAHMVVHGVLHLLGHDHETNEEAAAMERREREILHRLGVPDPYAEPAAEGAAS